MTTGRSSREELSVRMDFIGSSTNVIMVTLTSLMLFTGRFRLAPSANRKATAWLKLEGRDLGLQTGDTAGFTLADTEGFMSIGPNPHRN
ncbi:Photosystem I reaction center subunit psaK, chloroplastic [Linum perenne]